MAKRRSYSSYSSKTTTLEEKVIPIKPKPKPKAEPKPIVSVWKNALKDLGRAIVPFDIIKTLPMENDTANYIVNLTPTVVLLGDVFDDYGQQLKLAGYEIIDLRRFDTVGSKDLHKAAFRLRVIKYTEV